MDTRARMTILQLHKNEALRQQEFPVCKQGIFLAHAGVCPLPQRVAAAMNSYTSECMKGDQEAFFPDHLMEKTRDLSARLLGCATEEIALVGPTSVGLSIVANGLDWHEGDNVVFYAEDYPSNVAPWMDLARKGVRLRELKPARLGEITLDDLMPLVDARTRLVALASAHFISGYRPDMDKIGQWLHLRGVFLCVDGIQTLGAIPTSVAHVDFLAADAHKWLLGPCAAGILYVRREVQPKLNPTLLGWNNVISPGFIVPREIRFPSHAGRYEAGSPNLVGVVGLHACLSLILEYSISVIEETVLAHTRFLRAELIRKGYELAAISETNLSGITSFRKDGVDKAALYRKLADARMVSSLRRTRDGREWIRLSPHFYNTRSELEEVLTRIPG